MFEQFVDTIANFALANIVGLGAFATALTSLTKRYIPSTISATTLNTIIVCGVFAIAMVADRFEYLEQFNNTFAVIVNIVVALAGGLAGSTGFYHFARFTHTPFLQYSRGDVDGVRHGDENSLYVS